MYKNALKEDLIRVVEELDSTVESTDTIVKLKTKIENSSTFESDPDFVKTLIQNCIDERVSQNEREAWQWKQAKKKNRFEQEIRTLQRKISMRSTKINLLKRRSYACETMCFPVEPSGCQKRCLHMMEKLSSSEKL
ncbi:hypothetical protein TNCV_3010681 [Trichonephila clavipes]|nr:hypothetical protein TNCV_3010681 [Trichonephila clavipes]